MKRAAQQTFSKYSALQPKTVSPCLRSLIRVDRKVWTLQRPTPCRAGFQQCRSPPPAAVEFFFRNLQGVTSVSLLRNCDNGFYSDVIILSVIGIESFERYRIQEIFAAREWNQVQLVTLRIFEDGHQQGPENEAGVILLQSDSSAVQNSGSRFRPDVPAILKASILCRECV